ncbi:MAG: hypothetical protein CMJ78_26850 [Planctomycetaceae bacterium]|nr:hypothetical protein [Planctomycetaceae bacterium]
MDTTIRQVKDHAFGALELSRCKLFGREMMKQGLFITVGISSLLMMGCQRTIVQADPIPGTTASGNAKSFSEIAGAPASSILDSKQTPDARAFYHRVLRGESVASIARKYGVSTEAVIEGNGLDSNAIIQPGQLIYIPRRETRS